MRKVKFYFGKRRLKHTWGIDFEGRTGKWWVVPQILRGYFMREHQAYCERCGIQVLDIEVGIHNAEHSVALWSADRNGDNAILEKIYKHPAERSDAPAQVGTIRYCDYELEHRPEHQAAYNEMVDQMTKDTGTPP